MVTLEPGASAFALVPAHETYAAKQRHTDQAKMDKLEKEYRADSEVHFMDDNGRFSSEWLRDRKVQSMADLSDNYSLRSSSSMDLSGGVDAVADVATDLGGFAMRDTSIP